MTPFRTRLPARCALCALLAVAAAAWGGGDLGAILEGAPTLPQGYANVDALQEAINAGKYEVIGPQHVEITDDTVVEKDLEYGRIGDYVLLLDLYRPKQVDKPVPGLVFIHGGGWGEKGKDFYAYWTARYANRGYVCATIEYRMSWEAKFPAAVEDAKCAVRWMRANAAKYGVDPARIGVVGLSAGAHVALMVAYTPHLIELEGDAGHADHSSRVQAVVSYYGPTDLVADGVRDLKAVRQFIGEHFGKAPGQYLKASPITHVSKDAPPTLLFHGAIDAIVPVAQSDALANKLRLLGVPCLYDRQPGWHHAMDLLVDVNRRCLYIQDRFLDRFLPLATPAPQ